MAAPTTKAKKGGEWETTLRERREEAARLGAALRTRGNAKAVGKVALEVDEISAKLEAQYRRWELSGGCAIRRTHVCFQAAGLIGQRGVVVVDGAPPPHTSSLRVFFTYSLPRRAGRLRFDSSNCVGFRAKPGGIPILVMQALCGS